MSKHKQKGRTEKLCGLRAGGASGVSRIGAKVNLKSVTTHVHGIDYAQSRSDGIRVDLDVGA
jgi:hypothetical protein